MDSNFQSGDTGTNRTRPSLASGFPSRELVDQTYRRAVDAATCRTIAGVSE